MSERFNWDFKLTNDLKCLDKYEVVPTEDYRKYLRPNLGWIAKAYMDMLVVDEKETMTVEELSIKLEEVLNTLFEQGKLPYKVVAGVLFEQITSDTYIQFVREV